MSFKLYIEAIICHVFIAVIHKIPFLVWGDIIIGVYVINNSIKTSIYYNKGINLIHFVYIKHNFSRKFNYSVIKTWWLVDSIVILSENIRKVVAGITELVQVRKVSDSCKIEMPTIIIWSIPDTKNKLIRNQNKNSAFERNDSLNIALFVPC